MFLFRLIAQNLILIHKGSIVAKFKSTLFISLMASPFGFVELFSEWISENGGYLFFVLLAIAIDHLMGSAVHLFIKKDFSIKKNIVGLVLKIFLVFSVGILFEGFQYIYKEDNLMTEYLTLITRLMVFLYPAGSAFMNCAVLTNGKFPPIGWINKISKFNETLDVDVINKKKQDDENI